jgi:eukaryotic-like serine/threonine-protein kinase
VGQALLPPWYVLVGMSDEQPNRVGTVIAGKYRVDAELGRGGMGAVYRVTHVQVKKQFALKVLHRELASNREAALRFLKEAQVAGRIGHPAILDIYDVGECEDGALFMLMELLRGESLSAALDGRRLSADQATWIAAELLAALVAAHRAGVLHRDVKPQNVFLALGSEEKRVVKLLDFGIAKFQDAGEENALTRTGKIVGSPLYMAPEQARAESDIDARVDVWSVGATLYEMLTGAPAHRASSPVAVLARILTEPAGPLSDELSDVHPGLEAFVARSLKIARDERFASAEEMLAALIAVRAELGFGQTPPPTFAPLRPLPPREDARASERRAAHTSDGTALTNGAGPRQKGRNFALLVAMVGLLALGIGIVAPLMFGRARAGGPGSEAAPSAGEPAAAMSELPALPPRPPKPAVQVPAAAVVSAAKLAPSAASAPSLRAPSSEKPRSSRPACGPTEVLSSGHCCPRGLVWQNARCERPLATSF